jgi:hypothetical protein
MSPRQAANAANAQLSTGPRTPEGKERSKRNSLRHGLATDAVLMPWEDKAAYEVLLQDYTALYRPCGEVECELLQRVVDCFWRLLRADRVHDAFLCDREKSIREASNGELSGEAALVSLFTDPAQMRKLSLNMRYSSAAQRAFTKAMQDFEAAQKDRIEQTENDLLLAELARGAAKASPARRPEGDGFVSQRDTTLVNEPLRVPSATAPPLVRTAA